MELFPDFEFGRQAIQKRTLASPKRSDQLNMHKKLFVHEFETQEHLDDLMVTDIFDWCEKDVRLLQKATAIDVASMILRRNTPLKTLNECLIWVFTDNDQDFGVCQVAASLDVKVEALRLKYTEMLALKVRNLKGNEKYAIHREMLLKANSLIA